MTISYDDSSVWSATNADAKESLIKLMVSMLECVICLETMHIPFLLSCGHSFCYGCLDSWFKNKLNCPTCRHNLVEPPTLNKGLREVSNGITELFFESLQDEEQKSKLKEIKKTQEDEFEEALKSKIKLFSDSFLLAPRLIDTSDGVPRCGNCHWEVHGSVCLHCGQSVRHPGSDGYYDSSDGDAYNEDEQEVELFGVTGDAYDSEDSFVDNRDDEVIINDVESESENSVDLDGRRSQRFSHRRQRNAASIIDDEASEDSDSAMSSYNGEGTIPTLGTRYDGSRDSLNVSHVVSISSDSDEGDSMDTRDYDMRRAVDRLHQNHIEEIYDDEDEEGSGLEEGHFAGFSDSDNQNSLGDEGIMRSRRSNYRTISSDDED